MKTVVASQGFLNQRPQTCWLTCSSGAAPCAATQIPMQRRADQAVALVRELSTGAGANPRLMMSSRGSSSLAVIGRTPASMPSTIFRLIRLDQISTHCA